MIAHLRAKNSKRTSLPSLSRVTYTTRAMKMITSLSLCGGNQALRTLLMMPRAGNRWFKVSLQKRNDSLQA